MKKLAVIAVVFVLLLMGCQANTRGRTAVSSQDLIGTPVINQAGQTIGELEQIILDAARQEITYGVIQLAQEPLGFKSAGIAQQYIPVPWSQLDLDADNENLVVSSAAEALLENAPDLDDLDETLTSGWDTAVQAYWQQISSNPYESTANR